MTEKGFREPNYTQVPNVWLEKLLPEITTASELKVTLAVFRATLGFHEKTKRLSLSMLQRRTGMTRKAVLSGVEAAVTRGTISQKRNGASFEYGVALHETPASSQGEPELVPNGNQEGVPAGNHSRKKQQQERKEETDEEQEVLDCWLKLCDDHGKNVRSRELTPSRRRLIRSGLKEANVADCKLALKGLFLSDWHLQRGVLDLHHAFGWSPNDKRNLRQKIDDLITVAEKAGAGIRSTPSDEDANLARAKDAVRQMYAYPGNETAQQSGSRAVEWLRQHGIQIVAPDEPGGSPSFRATAS